MKTDIKQLFEKLDGKSSVGATELFAQFVRREEDFCPTSDEVEWLIQRYGERGSWLAYALLDFIPSAQLVNHVWALARLRCFSPYTSVQNIAEKLADKIPVAELAKKLRLLIKLAVTDFNDERHEYENYSIIEGLIKKISSKQLARRLNMLLGSIQNFDSFTPRNFVREILDEYIVVDDLSAQMETIKRYQAEEWSTEVRAVAIELEYRVVRNLPPQELTSQIDYWLERYEFLRDNHNELCSSLPNRVLEMTLRGALFCTREQIVALQPRLQNLKIDSRGENADWTARGLVELLWKENREREKEKE